MHCGDHGKCVQGNCSCTYPYDGHHCEECKFNLYCLKFSLGDLLPQTFLVKVNHVDLVDPVESQMTPQTHMIMSVNVSTML